MRIPKLCISYLVGLRDKGCAHEFIQDCAERIKGRPQITTDALNAYPDAIESAFGADVDYAQLHKIYRDSFRRRSTAVIPQQTASERT